MKRCEQQARSNHGQSIERLEERGGLDVNEAYAVLTGVSYRDIKSLPNAEASERLMKLVRELSAGEAEPPQEE